MVEVKMEPAVKTEVDSPSRRCRMKTDPAGVEPAKAKAKAKQSAKPSAWEVRVPR